MATTTARQTTFLAQRVVLPAIALVLVLAACGAGTGTPGPPVLDRDRASDIAWEALEPNTASHDRANWAVVEVRQASGRSVAEQFEGWTFYGACGGPAPPPNGDISSLGRYWFVEMRPQPATPDRPALSPTAPPSVPEPFMARAAFLIDESGKVIARVLACIVY